MTGTIKISELNAAASLTGTEEVPIVAGGATKRTTTLAIANLASVSSGTITIGNTPISGGTTTRVLYDNGGFVGEYAISGTGSVAMTNSPTLVTPALGVPTSLTLTNATGLPVGGIDATGTPSVSTFLRGDGSWQSVSVSPAGSTTQVQFNNAGAFGASANLTWTSPALTIGVASTTQGQLALANTTANSVTVQSSNSTSTAWTLTLPVDAGTNGYALTTNGSGVSSWTAISATPGGSSGQVQYNNAGAFGGVTGITLATGTLSALAITGGTVTSSTPVLDATQTWSTTATYTGIKLNITDSGPSNAASLLMDLQVGGTSAFKVTKAGATYVRAGTYNNASILSATGSGGITVRSDGSFSSGSSGSGFEGTIFFDTSMSLLTGSLLRIGGDVNFVRDAANTLALRNSTNAQTLNWYFSYTDASNYARGALKTASGYVEMAAETAGTGADNINVKLTPAGTGTVQFGTHSAIAAETVTGYITITDAGGTTRKLAVVS